jgi:pimeloyl-ACP methyl ester carboxylesterase
MDEFAIESNGLRFHCLADGPADGPLALCLHGFPDTAHTWRHLLPVLAEHGYRGVAPFMRGYAPTDLAPDGHYQVGALSRDANMLHQALGGGSDAVIIGHDWGALATYGAAGYEPTRWRKVVAAAVPPPVSAAAKFFTFEQLQRSWYTFFFQSPLADMAVPMDNYRFIDRLWADWSPGYDAKADLVRVKEALGGPERTAAAIAYYRAVYDSNGHDPGLAGEQNASIGVPPQPLLYLHGANDGCFGVDTVEDLPSFLSPGSSVAVIEGAGHFLQLEAPEEFNAVVTRFLDE